MISRDYTFKLLHCAYEVFNELGPGLLENIYEEALTKELVMNGFQVDRQVQVPVIYKGEQLCNDLRLDLLVDGKIILELKSVLDYKKLFEKQLYTYLRLMDCELGYVINFNVEHLKDGIHPVVNRFSFESMD
ncbi:MAG: GxxExxY protein [Bacteroidaceae bacterium]|jgi:GxxExxY protein|nr:GxxExxY protein [Bacteroidaceae bacterium]